MPAFRLPQIPRPPLHDPMLVTTAFVGSAAIVLLTVTSDAHAAAAGADKIGANLGGLLATWARSLFSGVVALISIVFLLNRRYNDLALFLGAAILVGGLIFASSTVANIIRAIWTTLGGS